jgi:DNA-binding NtrC family response regulator
MMNSVNGANKLAVRAAELGVTVEKLVADALAHHEGSIPEAARELKVSRQALWLHCKVHAVAEQPEAAHEG